MQGVTRRSVSGFLAVVLLIMIGVGVLVLALQVGKCDYGALSASGQSLAYPFDGANMFFGLTILKEPRDCSLAEELNVSWVSMQPVAIWAHIESSPGEYNWTALDREMAALQQLNLECAQVKR
jgi:hypothetical protein